MQNETGVHNTIHIDNNTYHDVMSVDFPFLICYFLKFSLQAVCVCVCVCVCVYEEGIGKCTNHHSLNTLSMRDHLMSTYSNHQMRAKQLAYFVKSHHKIRTSPHDKAHNLHVFMFLQTDKGRNCIYHLLVPLDRASPDSALGLNLQN